MSDGLGVFQHEDTARLFHALAGLINADNPKGRSVKAQVVADGNIDRFGRTSAYYDLSRPADWFPFDDAVVFHGRATGLIAEEEEERKVRGRNPSVDARFHPLHAGDSAQAFADCVVKAAQRGVDRL